MKGKKLYRSRKSKIIAGVCGGLGEYFDIDPWLIRILFLLIHGPNLLIYIIIWIFVPENPNQKLKHGK